MIALIKTWLAEKIGYIKMVIILLFVCFMSFLYVQNKMFKSDLDSAKQTISTQEQTIKNQKTVINVQEKTIELATAMEQVRNEVLETYSKKLDVKLETTNDLIKKIKSGGFTPSTCAPSESVKAVVSQIQSESKK